MTDPARRAVRRDLNRLPADPNWPTQQQDRQAAVAILQRHAAQGEPLRLLEEGGETADGERLWVRFPDWLRALARHYQGSHGNDAPVILQRVMDVLLPGERLH